MEIKIPRYVIFLLVLSGILLPSCKSIKHIPDGLKFNSKRHSHIRTMSLHMLYIDRVNGTDLNYKRMKRIYDVKTYPGMKTIDVLYSGGSGFEGRGAGWKKAPGVYLYWIYRQQKKRLRFRAVPGRSHYIQYIVHRKKPMTVWQDSHDYISHLRKKPVYKRDLSKNRTMTVSRTVRGSLAHVKKRFYNELMLQEYLRTFIGGWAISLMFYPQGDRITVNLPGIGEARYDNEVIGFYKFQQVGGNRVKIVMKCRYFAYGKYPNFMKQIFSRFDPSYRINTMK